MEHSPRDPGEHLVTHRAPPHLLQRAMAARSMRRSRHAVTATRAAVVGVALAAGVVLGLVLAPDGPEPVTVEIVADAAPGTAVPVQLVYHSEHATTVAVAGSFNSWDPTSSPMDRVQDGLFRTTVFLERGRHEYMFVVDGERWVTDVSAATWQDDGFGNRNAVLEL